MSELDDDDRKRVLCSIVALPTFEDEGLGDIQLWLGFVAPRVGTSKPDDEDDDEFGKEDEEDDEEEAEEDIMVECCFGGGRALDKITVLSPRLGVPLSSQKDTSSFSESSASAST